MAGIDVRPYPPLGGKELREIPDVAYVPMSNFSCHCLIDGLLTNQIALLLPVCGRTEFGKMFGIKGRRFLSTPSLLLPNFLAHPRRAPSLARFSFACSISAPLKKERNRLLRRLAITTNIAFVKGRLNISSKSATAANNVQRITILP